MLPTLLTIALLHWAVLLLPGFNFILIGQLAASGQRAAAMAAVAGMTTGTLLWASLAVAGVGVIFAAHPAVRQIVQLAGGVYLLQLAFKLWRSGSVGTAPRTTVPSNTAAFRVGLLTSALNPKIALFYGSVFATALPANPAWSLVVGAVALVYFNSLLWHTALATALSHVHIQRAYIRHAARLNRASAILVGAFGVKLLYGLLLELRASGAAEA